VVRRNAEGLLRPRRVQENLASQTERRAEVEEEGSK
tara:strand:- start:869 stop:976 length:108 start_codon:yes stop_codon:yes gene_type:complete